MHYFSMILVGLHYLHSKNIVHRDLKPANVLLDQLEDGLIVLKIGDFGISKNLQDIQRTETLRGKTSPAYKSPEDIEEKPSTTKVDIWALGIILY